MKSKKLLLLLATPLLLTACGNDAYGDVNKTLKRQYASFTVTVETSEGELRLKSVYDFALKDSEYIVNAKIQSYAQISFETIGSQVITNNKTYTVDAKDVSFKKYTLSSSTYKDIVVEETKAVAAVKNPNKFLGVKDGASDMSLVIDFGSILEKITLTYSIESRNNIVTYSNFVA